VATTRTEDGHRQNTKTSTAIQTERWKERRATEEEMEGSTSFWGLRNRMARLNLHEHDDDDIILFCRSYVFRYVCDIIRELFHACWATCESNAVVDKTVEYNRKISVSDNYSIILRSYLMVECTSIKYVVSYGRIYVQKYEYCLILYTGSYMFRQ
jgi:hypothetical protein